MPQASYEPKLPDLTKVDPKLIKEYLTELPDNTDGWNTEQLFTIQRLMIDMLTYCLTAD